MSLKNILWVFATVGLTAACSSDDPNTPNGPDGNGGDPAAKNPAEISGETRGWLRSQSNSTFDLYDALLMDELKKGNSVISPFSLNTALAMLANGDSDVKGRDLLGYLGCESLSELNSNVNTVLNNFPYLDADVRMESANSIWIDSSFPVMPQYRSSLEEWYRAEVVNTDFDKTVASRINSWVSEKTDGMIPEFFNPAEPVTGPFVLLNTFSFKAPWNTPFDEALTKNKPFTNLDGSVSQTAMMHAKEMTGSYQATEAFTSFTIPFGNGSYVISLVLPAEGKDFNSVIAELKKTGVENLTQGTTLDIEVAVPKFSVETGIDFRGKLPQLGLSSIFGGGIWNLINMDSPFMVGNVLQKVRFTVDEQGGEGAGTSAITTIDMSGDGGKTPKEFRADRPFLFIVTERKTATPIFLGRIVKL